ncbi:sel1 repeat family protein [Vibrio parahaemolyticus]|nr:sel1 repeat family protein [Vibrio parahaemolyticus]
MLEGNPYAALELSEQGEFCHVYGKDSASNSLLNMMGADTSYTSDVCSEKYFTKAVKGFEKLAAEGDLRAQYFLLRQKHWDKSKETRADYIHEIIRFAEAHYYQPLMDYVGTILYRPDEDYISKTPELYSLATKLLTIASNNNYIPAIERLVHLNENINKDDPLYLKLLNLDSPYYYASRILYFEAEYNKKELYCFVFAHEQLTGDSGYWIAVDDNIRNNPPVCAPKQPSTMVYIDGFTSRDDWRDRGGRY